MSIIRRLAHSDSSASLVIAWAGLALTAVGVVGIIARPRLLIVWAFLILFGTRHDSPCIHRVASRAAGAAWETHLGLIRV
jgi:hypothetical protein